MVRVTSAFGQRLTSYLTVGTVIFVLGASMLSGCVSSLYSKASEPASIAATSTVPPGSSYLVEEPPKVPRSSHPPKQFMLAMGILEDTMYYPDHDYQYQEKDEAYFIASDALVAMAKKHPKWNTAGAGLRYFRFTNGHTSNLAAKAARKKVKDALRKARVKVPGYLD